MKIGSTAKIYTIKLVIVNSDQLKIAHILCLLSSSFSLFSSALINPVFSIQPTAGGQTIIDSSARPHRYSAHHHSTLPNLHMNVLLSRRSYRGGVASPGAILLG